MATTTLLQQQNAVTTGEQSVVNASTTLAQDYQSGFDSLGPMFVNLQTVMTGLQSFMNGTDISKTQNDPDALVGLLPNYLQAGAFPYETALKDQYAAAVTAYQQNLTDYHAASVSSNAQTLDSLFTETYNTAQAINDDREGRKGPLQLCVRELSCAARTVARHFPLPPQPSRTIFPLTRRP